MSARAALYDRIAERVRALSGVTAAAWTSALPLTGETWVDVIRRPDAEVSGSERPSANYRFIGPEYFQAIGMPIMQGRSIEPQDRTSAITPAVINARAARAMWPGESAVGREFTRANPEQRFRVVGVVSDGRVTALESESPLMVYAPYWFNNDGKSILVVRAAGDPMTLVPEIRRSVRDVDPDVAVAAVAPLARLVDAAAEGRRYQATLFTMFGAAALLIAVVGVYAMSAYGVSRRRRELNIRVALGAQTTQVFAMVMRQSVTPVAAGLIAGLGGALLLGNVVASLLYEVRARDPWVLSVVLGAVAASGIVAAAAATFGGLRIEPAAALRDD